MSGISLHLCIWLVKELFILEGLRRTLKGLMLVDGVDRRVEIGPVEELVLVVEKVIVEAKFRHVVYLAAQLY